MKHKVFQRKKYSKIEPNLAPYYTRIRRRRRQLLHPGHNWLNLALGTFTAIALTFLFLCGSTIAVAVAGYSYIAGLVPEEIKIAPVTVDQSTKIYDRYGNLLFEVFGEQSGRRTVVSPQDIPLTLKEATIATEDPSFYENPGVDFEGIA